MRLMIVLLSIIVLQPLASAAESVVTVPPPRFAPTQAALHEWCGPGKFEACTRFVGYRLEAACDGARLQAVARVTALIRIRDGKLIAHEQEHIREVRETMDRHLRNLESTPFADALQCQAAALRETSSFAESMRAFTQASTLRMHPTTRALNADGRRSPESVSRIAAMRNPRRTRAASRP